MLRPPADPYAPRPRSELEAFAGERPLSIRSPEPFDDSTMTFERWAMSYRFVTIAGRRYLAVRYALGLATYTEREVLFEHRDDALIPVCVLDLEQDDSQSRVDQGHAKRLRASWDVDGDAIVYRWREVSVDDVGVESDARSGVERYRRSSAGQFCQARATRE